MSAPHRETEIKVRVEARAARRLLAAHGFRVRRRRVFESNIVYDTCDLALRRQGRLLRLRRAGRRTTLTLKGPASGLKHKSRDELECRVPEFELLDQLIRGIGFEPVFHYEKFRTEYSAVKGTGTAMLDVTPIGDFLELEGEPEWIDQTARLLGFEESSYITASYAALYLDYCRANGGPATQMVFPTTSSI
jgi:adenylate cyclase, class 2